jgi:hypothetical protein
MSSNPMMLTANGEHDGETARGEVRRRPGVLHRGRDHHAEGHARSGDLRAAKYGGKSLPWTDHRFAVPGEVGA